MKPKVLYLTHIMWYESKIVRNTLDTIQRAIDFSNNVLDIHFRFILNSQTMLEEPETGTAEGMFNEFLDHPVIKLSEIIKKTDSDPFYNIGDARRENYDQNYDYTIWGESDCLVPIEFFSVVNDIVSCQLPKPHVIIPSRPKMWNSFEPIEHQYVRNKSREDLKNDDLGKKMLYGYSITSSELDEINKKFIDELSLVEVFPPKFDAPLVMISQGMPTPFIPPEFHLRNEDTYLAAFLFWRGYKQYLIENLMIGHLTLEATNGLKRSNVRKKKESDLLQDLFYKYTWAIINNHSLQAQMNKMASQVRSQ